MRLGELESVPFTGCDIDGLRVQHHVPSPGRTDGERERVIAEAVAASEAGALAMVVEGVAEDLAREITEIVAVPTIGIGASASCDGQILVTEDMLGLFDWTPKFVRRYGKVKTEITSAVENYAREVRSRAFPGPDETYSLKSEKSLKIPRVAGDKDTV